MTCSGPEGGGGGLDDRALPQSAAAMVLELLDIDDCPKVCVMLALARANHPPNRPWTTRTHCILEGIAATLPNSGASTLIDAHLARVRAFLLVARRRGLPAELTHRVVSHVYLLDFWED